MTSSDAGAAARPALRFDDVSVGDSLPAVSIEVTYKRICMNAASTWDWFPGHHNPEYARSQGQRTIYLSTLFFHGFVDRGLNEWAGPDALIRRRTISMIRSIYPGQTAILSGKVVECDLVVAAEHATFAVSEVKVGRGSPWAAPLSWLVPPRIAMQILLTGDPITAERAHQVGLVNEVVPAEQLCERAQQLALGIAANAPLSVLASKRTVYLSAQHHLAAAYDLADEIWEPVYLSDDAQEGPTAFREKRAPQWKGR